MIYKQLLIIIYQNENYILIKLEHPSLYGEGWYIFIFSYNLNIHLNYNFSQHIAFKLDI